MTLLSTRPGPHILSNSFPAAESVLYEYMEYSVSFTAISS